MDFKGKIIFEGYAIAKAFVVKKDNKKATRKFEGEEKEFERFAKARNEACKSFDDSYEATLKSLGEEEAALFQTHKLMAEDLDFEDLIRAAISENMLAEDAVKTAGNQMAEMFKSLDDEYMKSRAADALEVASVISDIICGVSSTIKLKEPSIIICEDLEASKLMKVNRDLLKGIVFTKCGANSHVAIFTRTLEIPSLCSISGLNIEDLAENSTLVVDAVGGKLVVNPTKEEVEEFEHKNGTYLIEKKELEKYRGKTTVSKDGKKFQIYANIASSDEANSALRNDAEGVGLFRSEFLYLESDDYPSEDAQFKHYKRVVETMAGREVIIRTFDIGADKKADYFNLPDEENPALGYRSVRICRDRPEMFLTQVKALYRASAFGKLGIMVPMIISLEEINFVHEICAQARAELDKEGVAYDKNTKIGIMIETPAAAIMSDVLAHHVDFFSIGTNDLSQYTLACDRLNSNLNKTFDPLHHGILRLIKLTVENAHKAGITVGMCGELARNEKLVPFLMKIGLDEFSISSAYTLKVRKLMSTIDTSKVDISKFID